MATTRKARSVTKQLASDGPNGDLSELARSLAVLESNPESVFAQQTTVLDLESTAGLATFKNVLTGPTGARSDLAAPHVVMETVPETGSASVVNQVTSVVKDQLNLLKPVTHSAAQHGDYGANGDHAQQHAVPDWNRDRELASEDFQVTPDAAEAELKKESATLLSVLHGALGPPSLPVLNLAA